MVEKVGLDFSYNNYNTTLSDVSNSLAKQQNTKQLTSHNSALPFLGQSENKPIKTRTVLNGKIEEDKYKKVLQHINKKQRSTLETLLKTGILLNADSNDNSTVLDNLYKIVSTPRANGLDSNSLLEDIVSTLANPTLITQQFGDIPNNYRQEALDNNKNNEDIDVTHSGTCVAASTEFKLAKQNPAEFARFAEGLTSPKMSVDKKIGMYNLSDEFLNSVWLLNAFNVNYALDNYDTATLTFAPDKNAYLRARIQTTDRDKGERSPIDVLFQSTFMQVGSQQSYNSLTDKRAGKFNINDKGLIEFEKTFVESVTFDKNILSVTYQKVDDDSRLIGYETDLATLKRHLITALDEGETILIGYTQTDKNNIIINGHEITIVGYKKEEDGSLTFICNDTDDNQDKLISYSENYLLPKIHHAALPKHIVEKDMNIVPNWVESVKNFKKLKKQVA